MSRASLIALVVTVSLAGIADPLRAAITVTPVTQSGQNVQIANLTGHTSAPYNISFTVEPTSPPQTSVSSPTIRVQADNGEVINSITVDLDLPETGSRVNLVVNGTGAGLSGVGSISATGNVTDCEFWIETVEAANAVSGTLSANRIRSIRTLSAVSNGDISADIVESGSSLSPVSGAGIWAARHILGDITLEGPVTQITADGDIGTSIAPVSIIANNRVDDIIADSIYANIDMVDSLSSFGDLETRTGDFVGAGTGIDGLRVREISGGNSGIVIHGDFDAEARITTLDQPFVIHGDLPSGRTITIPADLGLEDGGQITINNEDDGSEWLGTVVVGNTSPITLTADPVYSETADSLGGGSIGEASFHLHESSCEPPDGGSVALSTADPSSHTIPPACLDLDVTVRLRFYGPVQIVNSTPDDEVVKVEKYNTGTLLWDDVTSSFQASNGSPLPGSRFINVIPSGGAGAWTVGLYRMSPYLNVMTDEFNIQSRDVNTTPYVPNFSYVVEVYDGCDEWLLARFDIDDDDDLTYEGDVAEWLLSPVDFTEDEVADEDDLDALLTAIDQFNE